MKVRLKEQIVISKMRHKVYVVGYDSQTIKWSKAEMSLFTATNISYKKKNTALIDSLTLGQICESDGRSVIKKGHECGSGLLSEEAANMCGAMTQRGASLDLGVKTHDT